MNNYLIVSYYTKGTAYKEEAEGLQESLDKLALPYHIQEVPNFKDWNKNTHYKAFFIRQMMERFWDQDIVWLDADARVYKHPKLFDELDCDIACHYRDWQHGNDELLSGTLFLKNIPRVKAIVKEWISVNNKRKTTWEQRNLQRVINRNAPILHVVKLPVEYCCIFDDKRRSKIDPVIEHFQVSRKLRREVAR